MFLIQKDGLKKGKKCKRKKWHHVFIPNACSPNLQLYLPGHRKYTHPYQYIYPYQYMYRQSPVKSPDIKTLKIKRHSHFVNASYLFTHISYKGKTYTITAQEPSMYPDQYIENLSCILLVLSAYVK